MFILAQVVSLLAAGVNAIAVQQKTKVQIMLGYVVAAVLFTVSFALLGAYVGAVACLIIGIQTAISYFFEKKGVHRLPTWLIGVFLVTSLGAGVVTYQGLIDILPILGSMLYVWLLAATKEKNIRRLSALSISLWVIYDFSVAAYVMAVTDLIFLISTIVAIFRYDLRGESSSIS